MHATRDEVNSIKNVLKRNNITSLAFLDDEANEKNIKALQSPKILHIATHGFFFENNNANEKNKDYSLVDSPLFRSGLLFVGCNKAIKDQNWISLNAEDGILTAYEALNLNLYETDLVVLSACETGLGEIKNGEGVYGLQRSFHEAGAKTILMSLWRVNDMATQELMSSFYQYLLKAKNKREAFKLAQKNLKIKYPAPYFWGAFVMIGE